jgi:hypothetical protein
MVAATTKIDFMFAVFRLLEQMIELFAMNFTAGA